MKLLDGNSNGAIDGLDYTGDGIADDIDGDSQVADEVVGVENYTVGKTYWRRTATHFSPVDPSQRSYP